MDWVGLVETIYDLETPSHEDWITKLNRTIGSALYDGPNNLSALFRREGDTFRVFAMSKGGENDTMERTARFAETDLAIFSKGMSGPPANTMSTNVGRRAFQRSSFAAHFAAIGMRDAIGLLARDGGPWGVSIAAGVPRITALEPTKARAWGKVTAHIHAALRLRFRVHGEPLAPPVRSPGVYIERDAVITPEGKVEHAEGEARDHVESLRHAAVSIDRARGRMRRRDPDGALEAWRSLVEGEWSLVEIFESDGRRFMVARRNAPDAPHVPLLDARERAALGLRARAHGIKLIAYELGLSESSVSRALSSAMGKLGLESMADVVRFAGSSGKQKD